MLLAVLCLCSTPKAFLHEAFANHTDQSEACNHPAKVCIHQGGYDCHFNNLVVNTEYCGAPVIQYALLQRVYPETILPVYQAYYFAAVFTRDPRGPPALC